MGLTVQAPPRTSGYTEAEAPAMQRRSSRDRTAITVGLIAAVLSVASTYYYFRHHLILGYQDSFSHLEISRRVVTGLSPGIAQLGGVWLPVPQLLQDLFSWSGELYRTGLAGSAVAMPCYVASTVLIYRIIRLYSGRHKAPAVVGAMVFATNVNVLYQQSTPMDELPFYVFTIAAVYYLVKWGEAGNPADLLISSVSCMLAVLCRYEGWFLAGAYTICVVVMARRLKYSWRDVRGLALINAVFGLTIPAAGWLLYNYVIFGTPLYFENGPTSSAAQMAQRHTDLNVGSWPLTVKAYGYAVGSDLGLAVIGVAALALIVFLIAERFSARSMPVIALVTIIPFFLVSLELGAEPISLPEQVGLLNYRFGLVVIIPAAILIGFLVGKLPAAAIRPGAFVGVVAAVAISGPAFARHQVVLATEAAQDIAAQRYQISAGEFLVQHTTGLILMNNVQNERVAFDVVDRTIYDGTRESGRNQWSTVLRDPLAFGIRVIVMRLPANGKPPDVVYATFHDSRLLTPFRLAYQNPAYLIYNLPTKR
jgi:hypothetical protein